jgi:hypothetical protein
MKHFALLISILSITFSCANQKNTHNKSVTDSAKVNKEIPINKPKFSPGTLALNIKIIEIIKNEKHYQIKAEVIKRMGTGAGITQTFTIGQEITFYTNRDLKLTPNTNHSFLFREIQTMGNKKYNLRLIREIK